MPSLIDRLRTLLRKPPVARPLASAPAEVAPAAAASAVATPVEDSYLATVRGVIHIGANTGQERDLYESFHLPVIWIEAIPEVFRTLEANLAAYPRQRAYEYLVTDRDGQPYTFHIANNGGASSSILDFSQHRQMWPEVNFEGAIQLTSSRFSTVVAREQIDLRRFDALVLDTQGAELKILMGSAELLVHFQFVKIEVPDFESYKGCCQVAELSAFMAEQGFTERTRTPFMHVAAIGTYFDILYQQTGK